MRPRIGLTVSTTPAGGERSSPRYSIPVPYVRCVEEAGGLAVLLPTTDPARAAECLDLVDGVVLIGGDDVDPVLYGAAKRTDCGDVDRARDDFEIALVAAADRAGLPSLGICRGIQVMNVALGGTLHQHVPADVPDALEHRVQTYEAAHPVSVERGSRLASILGSSPVVVNSHHHQAVDRCAARLAVTARAPDGVVEAAEAPDHPFLVAVQWHPERMPSAESTRRLFRALVDAAREGAARRRRAASVSAAAPAPR
jgi:putative glutamine amidotransferase